jgi:glucose-6-phosphate 1-dehydrogenase
VTSLEVVGDRPAPVLLRGTELVPQEPARRPEPCVLVIFGASGDLTRRKLLPAVYSLAVRRLLPERFAVVGLGRTPLSSEAWRAEMHEAVGNHGRDPPDEAAWTGLAAGMHYLARDFADPETEGALRALLTHLDEERATRGNRLFYMAVPPAALPTIIEQIGKGRDAAGWRRVVVEKPFGHDLPSARALNALLHRCFDEREIFRIDHYLGKETVQNLLVLRFANGIFEPLWNRRHVDHIEVTVAETLGIEGRADYYERAGAIRDIFQNHLLQLLALTAMEPPIDMDPEHVRDEKVKVLRALQTPSPHEVVRGQYGPGLLGGVAVPGYREEPGVAPGSATETYVAASLQIENWRWAGRPFYVRTGKRLARRATTITVQFQQAPHPPFTNLPTQDLQPNALVVRVQPDEGISLEMVAKVPGQGLSVRPVRMDFPYQGNFPDGLPDAYERLLLDAMLGDPMLFMREHEIEEQWALVDAIVAAWNRDRPTFPNYPAGSWGPADADRLVERDGRTWRAG